MRYRVHSDNHYVEDIYFEEDEQTEAIEEIEDRKVLGIPVYLDTVEEKTIKVWFPNPNAN